MKVGYGTRQTEAPGGVDLSDGSRAAQEALAIARGERRSLLARYLDWPVADADIVAHAPVKNRLPVGIEGGYKFNMVAEESLRMASSSSNIFRAQIHSINWRTAR